jgi:aspartate kinase
VRSIAHKDHIAVVNVVAAPMMLQFGFLERVADVFARHEIVVDVIATTEVSLALSTEPGARLEPAVQELARFSEVAVVARRLARQRRRRGPAREDRRLRDRARDARRSSPSRSR